MQELRPHVLVFSAFKRGFTTSVNLNRHFDLRAELDKRLVPYTVVEGHYEGDAELSFVVPAVFRPDVEELCRQYEQDAYLDSDSERKTFLVLLDGTPPYPRKYLGVLLAVTEEEAKQSGSYTYNSHTKTYYTTRLP